MTLTIEELLTKKGLKKIKHLDEIVNSQSFLVNSALGEHKNFIVYPIIHKKMNLTHNLLNLYGVHWSYKVLKDNWNSIKKIDGDAGLILSKSQKIKQRNGAVYAFTQRMIDNTNIYWIFKPNTKGWEYYQDVLIPIFNRDMELYKNKKKDFIKIYK